MQLTIHIERALLKCILDDNSLIDTTNIQPHHFKQLSNQAIFKAMQSLRKQDKDIDIVMLMHQLYDQLNQIGVDSINTLPHVDADVTSFESYEKAIIEQYTIRKVNELRNKKIESLDDAISVKEQIDKLTNLEEEEEYEHEKSLLELHQKIQSQTKGLSGYDTGFIDLNRYLDGLQKGDLIIIAARPSMGKTAFALNLVGNHCDLGHRSIVFSLEMPTEQLQKRMLSSIGNINGHKMRNPNTYFDAIDWDRYTRSLGIFSRHKLHIDDRAGVTVRDVRHKVKKIKSDYPDDDLLVVIDYLQLMRTVGNYERKDLEVGEITRSLKELAKEEEVPVILLSQLSRGVEQRQDKRPMMSDIRDSGSVEQDADVIMFLYRDDYYNQDSADKDIVEVIIAKQRNGGVGTVDLLFKKEFSKFLNLELKK